MRTPEQPFCRPRERIRSLVECWSARFYFYRTSLAPTCVILFSELLRRIAANGQSFVRTCFFSPFGRFNRLSFGSRVRGTLGADVRNGQERSRRCPSAGSATLLKASSRRSRCGGEKAVGNSRMFCQRPVQKMA